MKDEGHSGKRHQEALGAGTSHRQQVTGKNLKTMGSPHKYTTLVVFVHVRMHVCMYACANASAQHKMHCISTKAGPYSTADQPTTVL